MATAGFEIRGLDLQSEYDPEEIADHFLVKGRDADFSQAVIKALIEKLGLPARCQLLGSSWVGYFSSLKLGRKMARGGKPKYLALLDDLANDTVYSPGSNARATLATAKSRYNCRHALILYARYWGFPKKGDGIIRLKGQGGSPGWYGWRWKFPFIQKETVAAETTIVL